jgi:hypothetical protein
MGKKDQVAAAAQAVRRRAFANPSWRVIAALAMLPLSTGAASLDVEAALRETATHVNKSAPRPIGNIAILDGAEAHGRTLKYRFHFIALSKQEISSEFPWKQREFLTDFVCTTPEMHVFVENDVTLKYAYHDRNGKLVIVISVDTRNCLPNGP